MAATFDLSAFTTVEKTALLTAAKAELLRRVSGGSVVAGTNTGNQFSMTKLTAQELTRLLSALARDLGYAEAELRVAPNFANSAFTKPS